MKNCIYFWTICFFFPAFVLGQTCEQKFEKAVNAMNNFSDCSQTKNIENILKTDLQFAANNCPQYFAQNQNRLKAAAEKMKQTGERLGCGKTQAVQPVASSSQQCTDVSSTQKPVAQTKVNTILNSGGVKFNTTNKNLEEKNKFVNEISKSDIGNISVDNVLDEFETSDEITTEPYEILKDKLTLLHRCNFILRNHETISLDFDLNISKEGKIIGVSILSNPRNYETEELLSNSILYGEINKNLKSFYPAMKNGQPIEGSYRFKIDHKSNIKDDKNKLAGITSGNLDIENSTGNNDNLSKKIVSIYDDLKKSILNSNNPNEETNDKVIEITTDMENNVKKGMLKLLSNPKVSMGDVYNYIDSNLKSVRTGLKEIFESKLNELKDLMDGVTVSE